MTFIKKIGKKGHRWKGEKAKYQAKHKWIRINWGKAAKCEHCNEKNKKRYEWANISGNYIRNKKDWIQLCQSCHKKYDKKRYTIPIRLQKIY